ncbi:MAG: hypothetical protein JOZ05_13965 [Acetobacteraceae bacterium]|nr:hypothetical protein [Acetobacteraceae bacterium]
MTHLFPAEAARAAPQSLSHPRSPLPSLLGERAPLRTAIAAKRAHIAQLEAAWVAAAEAELARHPRHGIRIDDRATWDRETWTRYLAAAEACEPEFKPRIKRLLDEIGATAHLLAAPVAERGPSRAHSPIAASAISGGPPAPAAPAGAA